MPTTVTINQVTTADAAPTEEPYRVSTHPDHDDVTVEFEAVHDGVLVPHDALVPSDDPPGAARDTIGWLIRAGGIGPGSGKLVKRSAYNRCSPHRICGPDAIVHADDPVRVASGVAITTAFMAADADVGGGDRIIDINVYVSTEGQGWS